MSAATSPEHRARRSTAISVVARAVKRGVLRPAKTFICVYCNHMPADRYHHHAGYDKAHHLDVWPVCSGCHGELHSVWPKITAKPQPWVQVLTAAYRENGLTRVK